MKAAGDDFVSKDIDVLELTYGGIKGDFHEGLTVLPAHVSPGTSAARKCETKDSSQF